MEVFGEDGTGKSLPISAIRAWLALNNRFNEFVVTATTGSARSTFGDPHCIVLLASASTKEDPQNAADDGVERSALSHLRTIEICTTGFA
jgi:hypothetical protein